MKSQTRQVLQYMKEHGSITSYEAFRDLGITRLSGRIYDLKKEGHDIRSIRIETENRHGEKCHVSRYSLKEL